MNILRNKFLFIAVLIIILIIAVVVFWRIRVVKAPELNENTPEASEEKLLNFEGKIYSTPEGAQFNDYFISSDGQEYGIEAKTGRTDIKNAIINLKDSGKKVIIEGILLENVIDYGGRQIQAARIQEKDEKQIELANPASVYCEEQGGKLEIRDMDKGQVGICSFDNRECEEWAYFRGECSPEEGNIALKECNISEGDSVCSEEYIPVCARVINESGDPIWHTFSNPCHACISGKVIFGYINGECEK